MQANSYISFESQSSPNCFGRILSSDAPIWVTQVERNLSTLALKEYKEPVSTMETRHWKMNISNCPSGKIGEPTSCHENAIT